MTVVWLLSVKAPITNLLHANVQLPGTHGTTSEGQAFLQFMLHRSCCHLAGVTHTRASQLSACIRALLQARMQPHQRGSQFKMVSSQPEHKHMFAQELDFKLEAANSKRCQTNLNSKKSRVKGQVVVPAIEDGMVNHRVLVMEYVEGIKVTDRLAFPAYSAVVFQPEKLFSFMISGIPS